MWQEWGWCALLTSLPSASSNTLCRCSKAFDQEVWFKHCVHASSKPLSSSSSSSSSHLHSCDVCPIQMWNSSKNGFDTDKNVVLSLSRLSTSSLLPPSSLFHRNSEASASSRHISLLPFVTWHCWPDSPSARMVSTTVSNTFFYSSSICIFCEILKSLHND